jgi:cysteine desulfurase
MRWLIIIIVLLTIAYVYRSPYELYLDNNATTYPHPAVYGAIIKYSALGNASSFYAGSAKNAVENLKQLVLQKLGKPNHRCIITSGASESINLLFRGFCSWDSKSLLEWNTRNGQIWCSPWEHKTSIECVRALRGIIAHDNQYKPKRGDLVSVMTMNNETGNIFDINSVAALCKKAGAWFHTDITQYFGKITDADRFDDVDCFSISFHKLYMLPGIGALVVPPHMNLEAQICGTQNGGLRGGTESVALVGGAIETMKITFQDRQLKNENLINITQLFLEMLKKYRTVSCMKKWVGLCEQDAAALAYSGPPVIIPINIPGTGPAPNTLLISFVDNRPGSRFCNVKFREELARRNIKISIGSACNTSTSGASHILTNLRLPFLVRAGVLRFSFGDYNTVADVWEFERRCRDLLSYI